MLAPYGLVYFGAALLLRVPECRAALQRFIPSNL
jgi:hypothetical protein